MTPNPMVRAPGPGEATDEEWAAITARRRAWRDRFVARMAAHPRASIRAQAERMDLTRFRADEARPQWYPGELAAHVRDILQHPDTPIGTTIAGDVVHGPLGDRLELRPRQLVSMAEIGAAVRRLRGPR